MKKPSGRHPLTVKGLSKAYDDHNVIADFTAAVSRGEKIALMGRNGAGKTTSMRVLATLDLPTAGDAAGSLGRAYRAIALAANG